MTYARSDAKKKSVVDAWVDAVATKTRVFREEVYRCGVCRDVGWVELEPGSKATIQCGATVTVSERGPGTWRRCDGGQSPGCRWRLHVQKEAAAKAARDGKPSDGEEASL